MVLVDVLVNPGGVTCVIPDLVDLSTSLLDAAGALGASMVFVDVLVDPGVSRAPPWTRWT